MLSSKHFRLTLNPAEVLLDGAPSGRHPPFLPDVVKPWGSFHGKASRSPHLPTVFVEPWGTSHEEVSRSTHLPSDTIITS
ncbi:jg3929 [Pararge aegeria aegeria]|uniref:Jg3929 protein n=1 Tax=Pararge aegeria aegeria TaxID=348720 RepID=A0A8S4S100_9NEOP|nr:jg3929 [Pararge aegeria aegeria]